MAQPIQLVPNPFNWYPKSTFYRYLSNGRSNPKKSKNEVHLFSNPVNWSPNAKIRFLQISQQRSLESKKLKKRGAFLLKFWFWEDPLHPVNWSPTHSTGPQKAFFTDISATVAQIQKIQKMRCIYFRTLVLGGPMCDASVCDTTVRGSHGLSARRARRTKSKRPEGPKTRSWGPEGP